MKYTIRVKQDTVHKTDDFKQALKAIASLFQKGHSDIYLYGGRLGSWW